MREKSTGPSAESHRRNILTPVVSMIHSTDLRYLKVPAGCGSRPYGKQKRLLSLIGCLYNVILVLCLFSACSDCFVLDGSPTSFAQFPRWNPKLNGTLSLQFRTREPNGLLLYTDDSGAFDFFEVKLVEGVARLRFNLGGGTAVLAAGRNLHDSQWHTLQITRNAEETAFTVDEETQRRLTPGPDYNFGNLTTVSAVFVGGIPSWYGTKLDLLALPSAYFEPRFRGEVRNLSFASDDSVNRVQDMQEAEGIRTIAVTTPDSLYSATPSSEGYTVDSPSFSLSSLGFNGLKNEDDHCDREDPCQNNGRCISTDSGPICDCRLTDYEGDFCEQKRPPSEATFSGNEYLEFEVRGRGGEPLVSWSDRISLHFRTRHSVGVLVLLVSAPTDTESSDYLHVSLKGGALTVATRLGASGSRIERTVRPTRIRFDDNQWHRVVVNRKVREITRATGFCHLSVTVDGVHTERGSMAGAFSTLASGVVYIGGLDPHLPAVIPQAASTVRSNFVGCVKKVELMADSVSLDLIQLAKSQSALLRHHSDVKFFCQEPEASDPITFTTREAFLALPTWQGSRTGTIAFKFRTNEGTGLLMYNGGAPSAQGSTSGDVFALELLDGHVYLVLGLGSGVAKVKATSKRCDDGSWHTLTLRRTGRSGRIAVDEAAYDFTTPGTASQLDLEGPLYIGGLATPEQSTTVPPELWSAKLRYGFVGCMRSLVINSRAVDMAAHAREQDTASLRPSCHASTSPHCDSQPCLNGGVCSEGWNRFVCDCTRTSFTGSVCAKDASTLSFDGSQFLRISIPEGSRTQAEDVHLRFRSPRPGGLLLATTSDKSVTFLAIGLEAGKLKVVLNLGNKNKIIHFGQSLNDDAWHTVHLRRRGHKMDLHVDSESKSYDLGAVDSVTMDVQVLHLGAVHPDTQKPVKGFANFVGHMQHLVFNRKHYLDMAHSGQIPNMKVTAKFGKKDHIVHHPVTFKSKYTFLGLPQLRAYSGLNLYFQFKTMEPNGLILYNGGKGQDFVALELVNGHLHYVFNLGDGPRGVRSNTRNTLNDNRWHAVTIGRPSTYQHTLMVDDMVTKVNSPGPNTHLDLNGLLYVGGVRRPMYNNMHRLVHSKHGFQGCLASLDLNGETGDILKEALIPSTLVAKGCAGPVTKCSHSACANHGVCIQMLNSYACDCDMSSFSGPLCADESISYEFGPGTGLINFTYPADKRPDTKTDLVALGFITMTDNGVLVRIDSGSSNDYLELEIVDGNVLAVYNMGTEDHPIGEHSVRVNDGHYHVVRFTRSGANSTIQIDEHNVRAKQPTGHQLTVFNSHATVQVGGKRSSIGKAIERPFQGIISGLVFNGDRILDMAAEDDPRVRVEGDVELLMSLPLGLQQRSVPSQYDNTHRMMQSGASPTYEGDDLVYSGGGGGGSGCWDDEDDCGEIEPTSGDDLITPVYIPPTPRPQPRTTPGPSSSASIPGRSVIPSSGSSRGVDDTICDDEEDCVDGSGLGIEIGIADRSPRPTSPGGLPQPPTSRDHDDELEETAVGPAPPDRQSVSVQPPAQLYPTTMGTTTALVVTTPLIRQYWPDSVVTVAPPPGGSIYRRPTHEDEYPRPPPPPPIHPATPRSPTMSTSRSPPPVYGVPIPEVPVTGRERGFKPPPRAKSPSAADNTAMVIGIVAGVLIVIVIVALVVYRVRSWTGYSKADDEGGLKRPPYQAAPNAAPHYQQQAPPAAAAANGAIKGADPAKLLKQPKKKDVKDLKEWYV